MGKKLDALLGRNFKSHKFRPLVNVAISRLAVLKNQRQVKFSQARSDVIQLLQQGHHERALLRVEHVIKEQNMLDAFLMMESYCNLMIERIHLIEQDKVCPEELREAISSLLYASSRCGEFPELQQIRALFASHYGKDFVARAIELRNNCGVNLKMVQKLSTRQPELEHRVKALQEIASENGIVLQLEQVYLFSSENQGDSKTSPKLAPLVPGDSSHGEIGREDDFSDSMKKKKKYKDVADAAQAAFESAAYAAEAARAAVALARPGSFHPDDPDSPSGQRRKSSDAQERMDFESKSKDGKFEEGSPSKESNCNSAAEYEKAMSISSSESDNAPVMLDSMLYHDEVDPVKLLDKDIVLDESDSENSSVSREHNASSSLAGLKSEKANISANAAEGSGFKQHFKMVKSPFSVRSRQVRGY